MALVSIFSQFYYINSKLGTLKESMNLSTLRSFQLLERLRKVPVGVTDNDYTCKNLDNHLRIGEKIAVAPLNSSHDP